MKPATDQMYCLHTLACPSCSNVDAAIPFSRRCAEGKKLVRAATERAMNRGRKTFERCRALDDDGKRCRNRAVNEFSYHGDHELYGFSDPRPTWVLVALCTKHRGSEVPYSTKWGKA